MHEIFRSLLTYTATTVKLSATRPPFQHLYMHVDGVNNLLAFFQVSLQLNYRVQCIFMDVELQGISLINKKPNIDLRI